MFAAAFERPPGWKCTTRVQKLCGAIAKALLGLKSPLVLVLPQSVCLGSKLKSSPVEIFELFVEDTIATLEIFIGDELLLLIVTFCVVPTALSAFKLSVVFGNPIKPAIESGEMYSSPKSKLVCESETRDTCLINVPSIDTAMLCA
jgi:hypothetical protein